MNAFERWSVWLTSVAVIVTGFAILWFQYGVESPDPFAVVNHPLQIWALKGHVLVAPLFVLAIGFISVRHIWRHIVRGVEPGRRSGLLTAATLAPMIASGYLIQVVVSERLRTVVVVTHIVSSVLFTVGVGFHLVLMWRYLRRLRTETFCAQVRMSEELGMATRDVRGDREPKAAGTDDERDTEKRDLAEAGRSA
ncbi:MAG: hypothetical protein ACODAA_03695 [Gemmatimonadota bacterium]